MATNSVIKHLDVSEHVHLRLGSGDIARWRQTLRLQARKERFDAGIVITIPSAAVADDKTMRRQQVIISAAGVQAILVTVMQHPGRRLAVPQCLTQRGADGNILQVIFTGRGYGHGVGMCQMGARGMAAAGITYDSILHLYYQGTDLKKLY